jgi:3-dehydroquinate synthase
LAIIKDVGLFRLLEEYGPCSVEANFQDEAGGIILDRSISGMLEELGLNLFEDDLERKVDFGHTFSYGLEIRCEACLLHGEAVLLDIVISTMIAHERGLLTRAEADRIFQLIDDLGISLNTSVLDPNDLWQSLEERTYHRNGFQRVPLPNGLGECIFLNDIELHEIQSAYDALISRVGLNVDGIK